MEIEEIKELKERIKIWKTLPNKIVSFPDVVKVIESLVIEIEHDHHTITQLQIKNEHLKKENKSVLNTVIEFEFILKSIECILDNKLISDFAESFSIVSRVQDLKRKDMERSMLL